MQTMHGLGPATEIPEGGSRVYTVGAREIAVFNIDGELHAIENRCGRGLPLDRAQVVDGQLLCPWHGWTFDLRQGRCAMVPDHRTPVLTTRVERGVLYVELDDHAAV